MRARLPSQTAAIVTVFRALADAGLTGVPGFRDPTARALLPPMWRAIYDHLWRRAQQRGVDLVAGRSAGHTDGVVLRTVAIDDAVRRAIDAGCRQLVILGAGLDGRAYRMPELAACDVFEVDHPATQRSKRRRAAALRPLTRALEYVSVDFTRDSLDARLAAAGHRANVPTAWIWEGVVMYLGDDALRATLRAIAARSAPGSTLIVNYHVPSDAPAAKWHARRMVLGLIGEPQIGLRTPDAMRAEVERAGLRVVEDAGARDLETRYGARYPISGPMLVARLLVAVRE